MTHTTPLTRRQFVKQAGAATAAFALGPAAGRAGATEADVLIVGAGAFGCNTAWHLLGKRKKVLVLDARPEPATQASRAGAGFVALWSGVHVPGWGKVHWAMQRYGIDFYTRLARDAKADFGLSACGICYVYQDAKRWEDVQARAEKARAYGTKLEVLDDKRAGKVVPPVVFRSAKGILFDPEAIRVRAGDATRYLAGQLGEAGVRFRYRTPVTGFIRDGDRVVGVKTGSGELRAPQVVVAAGAWSRRLLKAVGADCPVSVSANTRYTTKALEGLTAELPNLIFSDRRGFYIRYERGGLLIGGDYQPKDPDNPSWASEIDKAGADRVRLKIREIEPVMPVLKKAEVDEVRSGTASATKDSQFILDEVPGAKGLYVMTGCQEAGITHGPALGKMMAELLVDSKTGLDREPFRLTRFKGT